MKISFAIIAALLLSACNMANFSYPPEKFQRIDSASFNELMTYNYDPNKNDKTSFGPKIAYSMGSYGGLATVKKADGRLLYKFYGRLEYLSDVPRRYDTVTDVSGRKVPFKTGTIQQANGGYMHEYVTVNLSKEQLEEAKYEGLFLTFTAKEHEKRVAQNEYTGFDLNKSLAMINELQGGTNREYKNNDNFDVSVPTKYIEMFLNIENN